MSLAYLAAVCLLLLFGWRAWFLLREAQPFARALGTVSSALLPFPAFLVVLLYHYAAKRTKRRIQPATGAL